MHTRGPLSAWTGVWLEFDWKGEMLMIDFLVVCCDSSCISFEREEKEGESCLFESKEDLNDTGEANCVLD